MAVVWGMPEYHFPRMSGSQRMTVAHGSILFDDARAQTLSSDPQRSDLWLGSVVLPVSADRSCDADVHLRGWVRTAPPARATLFASVGPWRLTIPYDDVRDEAIQAVTTIRLGAGAQNIAITLLLRVEGTAASLSIDTVDVAVRTSAA